MPKHQPDSLTAALDALLGRARRRMAWHGVTALLGWGGGALVLAAWLVDGPGQPSAAARWGLSLSTLAVIGVVAWRQLGAPLLALGDRAALVRLVERRRGQGNLLVAAEESLRDDARWGGPDPVRRELRRRVRERAAARLRDMGPVDVVDLTWRRTHGAAAGGTLAVAALLILTGHGGLGLARLARPWVVQPPVPRAGLLSLPTAPWVVSGSDLVFEALDVAGGPGLAVCEIRRGEGPWQPLDATLEGDARSEPGRLWRTELADVREDVSWRFRRGTIMSIERHVVVRDHPLLAELEAVVTPPAYTGADPRRLERLPSWIEVPAGSRVELLGRSGGPVARAAVVVGADTLAMSVDGERIRGVLTVDRDTAFLISLVDVWGLANAAPLRYEIAAAADQVPQVVLARPGDDGLMPLEAALELELDAADDYGIEGLALQLRGDGAADWRAWPVDRTGAELDEPWGAGRLVLRWVALGDDDPPLRAHGRLVLDAGALRLAPGSALELRAEARDNRRPGPAGRGLSGALRLQVPTAGEVLDRQDEAGRERRAEMAEARRRSRELDADLDRLMRELMKNPDPDWARQQEMEDAIRRQAALQDELSRVAGELQAQLERFASEQLTSEAQLQRADEVAELLSRQADDAVRALMERLQQQGEAPDAEELARALREAAQAQQELARRLDAALAVMDRMAREQELESMTAMLEQMMRQQQELADESRDLAGEQPRDGSEADPQAGSEAAPDAGERRETEDLAARQEALSEQMKQMRERLEEAVRQMNERAEQGEQRPGDEQARQDLQEALEKLQEQMDDGPMDQAAEQLEQMNPEQAAQLQQQAMRDLGSLYHVLLKTQQAMQMAMQMNQVTSLRGLAADLLAVSARQEEIAELVPDRLRDVRSRELARRQHRLQAASLSVRDGLGELVEEAPQRMLRIIEKVDGIIEEMGAAVQAMEDGRAGPAQAGAREALSLTNTTVISLLTEAQMNMQGQGGGGSSSSDPSEQLQEMAREQARLNGATDELRRMLADRGMSQEARSMMKRLGEEQAGQAGRARELAEAERERPDGGRLLGDLQAMGDDLESIARDLGSGLVSEETLVRQERILSRMLDARNAARRRDYSTRRESRTADELYGDAQRTPRLGGDGDDRRPRMRYQALEKAPLEYRDLVRRYFAGLDSLRGLEPPQAPGRSLP